MTRRKRIIVSICLCCVFLLATQLYGQSKIENVIDYKKYSLDFTEETLLYSETLSYFTEHTNYEVYQLESADYLIEKYNLIEIDLTAQNKIDKLGEDGMFGEHIRDDIAYEYQVGDLYNVYQDGQDCLYIIVSVKDDLLYVFEEVW